MRRKLPGWPLIYCLTVLMAISACTASKDPFDPPDFTPAEVPADWMTVDVKVQHIEVAAVALEKVPARSIALPEMQTLSLIKPLPDGGCLAVSQVPMDVKDPNGNTMACLRAIRFKADGAVDWDRSYGEDPYTGYPVSLCILSDGGFAVSLRVSRKESASYDPVDRVCRFSADGAEIWRSEDDKTVPGGLEHLFATQDGAVLAAGMAASENPDGSFNRNHIVLSRFEKDGRLSKHLILDAEGNAALMDAAYTNETGLVLAWWNETADQGSAVGVADQQVSQIGCFSENLNARWISKMAVGERLYKVSAMSGEEGVLASGTVSVPAGSASAAAFRSALFCCNEQGERTWTYSEEEGGTWIQTAVRLSDGRFVGGWHRTAAEGGEASILVVLSNSGTPLMTLDPMPGIIQQLAPTKDGGWTAILRQTVGPIPQPPYISSLWTDSEAIVAHYDRDLRLVWRRTIDQYKHVLRMDLVVPTADDQLLIG